MAKRMEIVDSKVFEARMNALPVNVVAQLTLFYSGVAELKGMIDTHVKLAVNDDVVLAAGKKKTDDATVKEGDAERAAILTGKVKYGVIVQPGDRAARAIGAAPVSTKPELPPFAPVAEIDLARGRIEHQRSCAQHVRQRARIVLRVMLQLRKRDIAGRIDEFTKILVGHRRLIDPEAVHIGTGPHPLGPHGAERARLVCIASVHRREHRDYADDNHTQAKPAHDIGG